QAIHHPAGSELQQFPDAAQIFTIVGKFVQADDAGLRLAAPSLVGGGRRSAEIDHQVPSLTRLRSRNRVVGMEQKHSHGFTLSADARPTSRRTQCSSRGEDLTA